MTTGVIVEKIVSLERKELEPYRTLRRPVEHMEQGIFVAEGEKVVRRLLASDLSVVSMLMTQEWYEGILSLFHQSINPFSDKQQVQVFIADKNLLEKIVGYNLHQGIMAVAKLPSERSLDETIASIAGPYVRVALDGLVNAENVGVIMRNCAAFGVHAVIVGETSSSPYLRRAVRNSMGAVFQIPVVHVKKLAGALTSLRKQFQCRIIAADGNADVHIHQTNFSGNICIVFGNEDGGISRDVLSVCSERVSIPMDNGTDSLNVANASAVFFYEARKQR